MTTNSSNNDNIEESKKIIENGLNFDYHWKK